VDNALEASFVDLALSQIKGKENKAVVRKYRDYVEEFLTKFQITKFGYGGLNDLENCGLFKLKKGGYVNVEEIGEHVAQMDDGSVWHRVDNEYVELMEHTVELNAKWYLYDKTGRAVGGMTEEQAGVIKGISLNNGYNMTTAEKEKYKNHIVTVFNSKYDKGRSGIVPAPHIYHGFYNTMEGFGLGVDGKGTVNEPQIIGRHVMKHNDSDVYATGSGQGDVYWVISGDKIKSRFLMNDKGDGLGYLLVFDNNRGIPNGAVTNFVKKFQETFPGDININYIQIQDQTLEVANIEWRPGESSEFIMEEDGVRFYTHVNEQTNSDSNDWKREEGDATWYMAIDKHDQLIFSMMIDSELRDSGIQAHQNRFKVRMVNNKKVAGYYAIYLINHLDAETGYYTDYSSFARELLDETGWFEGQRSNTWYVEDPTFKIHMTITDSFDDDTEEDAYDDDTTMETYWNETGLQDSGMENDYFASEYEQVYRGGNIGYDDENWGEDDPDNPGRQRIRVDYYVEGIGDDATVTHPVSGGSVRISL
jgi:hypothetical protein